MVSKSGLAIVLSRLKQFENPKASLEQYSTDSEIAADMLWFAYMNQDIEDKKIADLGCGPGIFGIGALKIGAKFVYFVDKDDYAIKTTKENLDIEKNLEIIKLDVSEFDKKVDTVLMNPPFGTKIKHHDKVFLQKAVSCSNVIYSIHKITSKGFIEAFSKDNGFKLTHIIPYKMALSRTMKFHKKNKVFIEVACFRLQKV
jgi:putative methylase